MSRQNKYDPRCTTCCVFGPNKWRERTSEHQTSIKNIRESANQCSLCYYIIRAIESRGHILVEDEDEITIYHEMPNCHHLTVLYSNGQDSAVIELFTSPGQCYQNLLGFHTHIRYSWKSRHPAAGVQGPDISNRQRRRIFRRISRKSLVLAQ